MMHPVLGGCQVFALRLLKAAVEHCGENAFLLKHQVKLAYNIVGKSCVSVCVAECKVS